jgi:hypothetical protein
MKKIAVFLFISFLFYNHLSHAVIKGTGEVKLSERSLENFLYYLRGDWPSRKKGTYTPAFFILSSDGNWSTFQWCGHTECWSNEKPAIIECETQTRLKCGAFAVRRTIYWDNGTNTSKNKAKFKSKWSDDKVKSELIKIGFYGEVKNQSINSDLSEKLESLIKLYEDGVLTEEQYNNAKKKLLD